MLLLDDDDELPLTPDPGEATLATSLGQDGLRAADDALLRATARSWLKVARVVSDALESQGLFCADDGPADLFTRRLLSLIEAGYIECVGNPRRPRFSEVRLPPEGDRGPTRVCGGRGPN